MSDDERKELEEENRLLKTLLDFYQQYKRLLVDPLFLAYFHEYMLLKTDQQRKDFWNARRIDADPETTTTAWRYGMQRLAERADDLKRRVIAARSAEGS